MIELKGIIIPDDVKEAVNAAKSDKEACKAMADAGLDVEQIERALPDHFLDDVSGGWNGIGKDSYHCPHCGNDDRDRVSRQFWASMFMDSATKYRCKNCNHYFTISSYGTCKDLGSAD